MNNQYVRSIRGTPALSVPDRDGRLTTSDWLESTLPHWTIAFASHYRYLRIMLGNIGFLTLHDWTITMSLIERAFAKNASLEIVEIHLLEEDEHEILEPKLFKTVAKSATPASNILFKQSARAYRLGGFLESLGTANAISQRLGGVGCYPKVGRANAEFHSFYTGKGGNENVIMPLLKIRAQKDESSIPDHQQFLDPNRISNWRTMMADKYRDAPIFTFEELWRVFCYELTSNIFDHAESSGYLSCRIFDPSQKSSGKSIAIENDYPNAFASVIRSSTSGFLELTVSDGGIGLVNTLSPAYESRLKEINDTPNTTRGSDILSFAFDEIGTSKSIDKCWATERHALGRILLILCKYGGALKLRSGRSQVLYVANQAYFKRLPGHLGFEPTERYDSLEDLPGTHFQLIIPLFPNRELPPPPYKCIFASLSKGFKPDITHPAGHLVPLREKLIPPNPKYTSVDSASADLQISPALTTIEINPDAFRLSCESLVKQLIAAHPAEEPLVIDFSGLNWTVSQFQTLLHNFQNLLTSRPAILVEIDQGLANEMISLYDYSRNSLSQFVDTYSSIHVHLMGIDTYGERYLFCAPSKLRAILLSIADKPLSESDIIAQAHVSKAELDAVLNNVNPIFKKNQDDLWTTVWSSQQIDIESRRAMTRNFGNIAELCKAWRGREHEANSGFNLPWSDKWVGEFFESSRILSRQRYSDEIAQRIIYRIEAWVATIGLSIEDITVLACATAPSSLLAYAVYKWWPVRRPAIADLGPYLMLNPRGVFPTLESDGSYLIVQDVLDTHVVSQRVADLLLKQGKRVIGVVAFARLCDDASTVGYSNPTSQWDADIGNNGIYSHAMIRLLRPSSIDFKSIEENRRYWVEPRTLRTLRYNLLRRIHKQDSQRVKRTRAEFYTPLEPGIVRSGHYVYGERHYPVALDIKRAFEGFEGSMIQDWIASVCLNRTRERAEWETERGYALDGEVTVILMPLHSRVHYIWPRIEDILAQSGKRLIALHLDATLFMGFGPAYRLPMQFEDLIKRSVVELAEIAFHTNRNHKTEYDHTAHQIRVMILDDAIVRARTAETILAEIARVVEKTQEVIYTEYSKKHPYVADLKELLNPETICPVQWIRYFSAFSQMGHARQTLWKNLQQVGDLPGIPFVFESYRWIVGMASYVEADCPLCARQKRLVGLEKSRKIGMPIDIAKWAKREAVILHPIALDSPFTSAEIPTYREIPSIYVLNTADEDGPFSVNTSDVAVLRFYELMYFSHPPEDVLLALKKNMPSKTCLPETILDFEKYRWSVLEWCVNFWPRVTANSAEKFFFEQLRYELLSETPLFERALEAIGDLHEDISVRGFVWDAISCLEFLEYGCYLDCNYTLCRVSPFGESAFSDKTKIKLFRGLALFVNSLSQVDISNLAHGRKSATFGDEIEIHLNILSEQAIYPYRITCLSLLSMIAADGGIRAHGAISPKWVLRVMTELVFRGRDTDTIAAIKSAHRNLVYLLRKIMERGVECDEIFLLRYALGLFVPALRSLRLFGDSSTIEPVLSNASALMKWTGDADPSCQIKIVDVVKQAKLLFRLLDVNSGFCRFFDETYRMKLSLFADKLRNVYFNDAGDDMFFIRIEPVISGWRLLTRIASLMEYIRNISRPNSKDGVETERHALDISRHPVENGTDLIALTVYSTRDPKSTKHAILHGRNHDTEVEILESFGVQLPEDWLVPDNDMSEYRSCCTILVPAGYIPRTNTK